MICAFSRNVQPSQQQLSMKSNTHGLDTTQPRAAENTPELGLIINSHEKVFLAHILERSAGMRAL